jgi:hypothetical protein
VKATSHGTSGSQEAFGGTTTVRYSLAANGGIEISLPGQIPTPPAARQFLNLPPFRERLLDYMVCSQEVFTYNLDKYAFSQYLPVLLGLSKLMRIRVLYRLYCNDFTVRMTTSDAQSTFDSYKMLVDWASTRLDHLGVFRFCDKGSFLTLELVFALNQV